MTLTANATRRGRHWLVHVPEHNVYGCGRTLRAADASARGALKLLGVDADLTLVADTPELAALRAADEVRTAALRAAVTALRMRRATITDIAAATGAKARDVKAILADTENTQPESGTPTSEPILAAVAEPEPDTPTSRFGESSPLTDEPRPGGSPTPGADPAAVAIYAEEPPAPPHQGDGSTEVAASAVPSAWPQFFSPQLRD